MTGSEEKLAFCKSIGADVAINYKTEDFVERVKEETGGQGSISYLHDVIFLSFLAFNTLCSLTSNVYVFCSVERHGVTV